MAKTSHQKNSRKIRSQNRRAARRLAEQRLAVADVAAGRAVMEPIEDRLLLSGDGLAATYYDNVNLSGTAKSRVDATVNFDFGTGAPITGIAAGTYSARWTGSVEATKNETYTFYTLSDDGVRLWVNGQQIINNWTDHPATENKGIIALQAGKRYDVKLEYFNNVGGGTSKLFWSSASIGKQIIPQSQLYSSAAPTTVTPPPTSGLTGSGNGLAGTYFDNDNFTGTSVQRIDSTVNFDFGAGSPISGIGADSFSVRWTGQVQAAYSQEYTFYTVSDDGVRLWVNGQQIVNNWSVHAPAENSGKIYLEAGKKYDIKMEYYDGLYGAVAKLLWSSASTPKQAIPAAYLYSTATTTPTTPTAPTTPVTGNGNGFLGTYFDNQDFTGKSLARTDATVAFDFGTGAPVSGFGVDSFSVRWTGQVLAPYTGDYTFKTTSDDGVRLWVNGVQIINDWTSHPAKDVFGKIRLEAGKKYDLKMEYFDSSGGASAKLAWSTPNLPWQTVPKAQVFSATPVQAPDSTTVIVPNPTGTVYNGLLGTYFNSTTFSGSSATRIDADIAFDWGTSSPHEVVGSDGWTARWQGQIQAPKTDTYTFYAMSDEGVRVWVNGQQIINDWTAHARHEVAGKIYLEAGKKYDIKVEYFDQTGDAAMQLRWSSSTLAKQMVPTSALFCSKPVYETIAGIPAPAATGPFKFFSSEQQNFRPGSATDKALTIDGYRLSKLPIDTKGLNIAATDLTSAPAWAYKNITIKNTEISDLYRTAGYHNDFIRIAGAAGKQDTLINVDLENLWIHTGQAIPILITDGDYDTIVIRNVKITDTTVNQVQINTQIVGSVKRVIVENCPGLSVAIVGRPGSIGEVLVRNSPNARVADTLNNNNTRSGAKITVLP